MEVGSNHSLGLNDSLEAEPAGGDKTVVASLSSSFNGPSKGSGFRCSPFGLLSFSMPPVPPIQPSDGPAQAHSSAASPLTIWSAAALSNSTANCGFRTAVPQLLSSFAYTNTDTGGSISDTVS